MKRPRNRIPSGYRNTRKFECYTIKIETTLVYRTIVPQRVKSGAKIRTGYVK